MLYFFILPAFVVWLIASAIALILLRNHSSFPYAWRMAVWSSVGFTVANIVLVLTVAGTAAIIGPATSRSVGRDMLQFAVGLGGILGPLPASLFGWVAGVLFGFVLARRRERHLAV